MSIRVKGLDKALKDIRAKGDRVVRAAVEVLAETADAIEYDAKVAAPNEIEGKTLNIKQRIDKIPSNGGLNWMIGIQGTQDFDVYVEAGTGQSAVEILNSPGYTQEMRDIAMAYYKNGQGRLIGKPFLFPSWIKNTANLVEEMRKEIEKAVK